ncbi:hypothetical protein C4546_00335 [Candidatus Parcubacteria bacterium]|jgi:hypothetical protein|nr:MAG: hypothetical protein C4546_00335 [Candidatus Parcubacteria bacterium]
MRIYFFQAPSDKARFENVRQEILDILEMKKIFYVTSDGRNSFDIPAEELEALNESGGSMLDKMDALIIEGSTPNADIGYLLAYAMSLRRPVLYLYDKDISNKGVLKFLGNRQIPSNIHVKSYSGGQAKEIVEKFLTGLQGEEAQALPTIKFTLRITPQMERYLQWKAKKFKMTKADFLREKISEEIMKNDEEYKRYLGRK